MLRRQGKGLPVAELDLHIGLHDPDLRLRQTIGPCEVCSTLASPKRSAGLFAQWGGIQGMVVVRVAHQDIVGPWNLPRDGGVVGRKLAKSHLQQTMPADEGIEDQVSINGFLAVPKPSRSIKNAPQAPQILKFMRFHGQAACLIWKLATLRFTSILSYIRGCV